MDPLNVCEALAMSREKLQDVLAYPLAFCAPIAQPLTWI